MSHPEGTIEAGGGSDPTLPTPGNGPNPGPGERPGLTERPARREILDLVTPAARRALGLLARGYPAITGTCTSSPAQPDPVRRDRGPHRAPGGEAQAVRSRKTS